MRASIIVVTFNHRDVIGECLEATLSTLTSNDEILVVDNASSDGTPDFVDREFQCVRLLRSRTNGGFGAACNWAVREARGRVLVFLNPDAVPRANWLEGLIEPLGSRRVGLTTAKIVLHRQPDLIDAYGNDLHISGIPTCHGWGQPAAGFTVPEEVAAVSGACFAISRALFLELGGFDERLFLYYEDDDLSLRARLAGYRCLAVPNAVVLHDHQAGFSARKLRYLERNRWWSLLKVLSWRSVFGLTPVLFGGACLALGLALRSGPRHVVSVLAAYADLASWLADLPSARRRVQSLRAVSDAELLGLHSSKLRFAQVSDAPAARQAEHVVALVFGGGRRLATLLGVR